MKIRSAIIGSIVTLVAISIAATVYESEQSIYENKIRVAFFPNIGHAVPIIAERIFIKQRYIRWINNVRILA